jgi:molecular chaperone HtpG
MEQTRGSLSIEESNIFAILKKWLYSEQDILFRELVSNASDAIAKRAAAEASATTGEITVRLDPENGSIVISDNGVGMTAEELDRYINHIAFSGASDFIKTHKGKDETAIIGHFGVGFYSAFMAADKVAIHTKSHLGNADAVYWECDADMNYSMSAGSRHEVGTEVILYVGADSAYLSDPKKLYDILKKYFVFLATPVYLDTPVEEYRHALVNDPAPTWKDKSVAEDSAELAEFYKGFFDDIMNPVYCVRFESIDIGVSGMVFFRNTKNGTEEIDGSFKVYSRGVFVGENIPSLIPKFVNLQSGIIDCKNLPLVVSREGISGSGEDDGDTGGGDIASLIYETLVQEVTIAMNRLFADDRDRYESLWSELNAFVKYAVIQDKVFASVMANKVLFQDIYGKFATIAEYRGQWGAEGAGENGASENGASENGAHHTIYYVTDPIEQARYIEIFKQGGMNALIFDHVIDQPFLRRQEVVHPNTRFVRIDSDLESLFKGDTDSLDEQTVDILEKKLRRVIGSKLDTMRLHITNLKTDYLNMLIIHDEKSRRMADMLEMYGMIKGTDQSAKAAQSHTVLLVNMNNSVIRYAAGTDDGVSDLLLGQCFDLALLSQGALEFDDVENFILRNEKMMELLIKRQGS